MPARRPSSARPRRSRRAASAGRRKDPSRMRDGLRARVDQVRRQDFEERERRGMFSGGGGGGGARRLHVQTVGGQRRSRVDGAEAGAARQQFRPQSARTRRGVSPLKVNTGVRQQHPKSSGRQPQLQERRRRRARPLSARQERPFSPIAEMAAASRLSPIASYRNDDGFAYDTGSLNYEDDSGELYMTYSEELEAMEDTQALADEDAEAKSSMQRRRRVVRRALSSRKRRPLTAGRKRRVKRTRARSARQGSSRIRPSTAANILRYSDNDSVEGEVDGRTMVTDGASPNTRTALARSEDLLERARAYLLNRQGLNSNTRRFLEQKEQAIVRVGSRSPNRRATRGRGGGGGRTSARRARPASAGRYHPMREEQFGMGAGRMVAASQGRLSSKVDYDRFGLGELEQEVRQCLFDTQGVIEVSRLVVEKLDKGRGVRVNVHISVDSGTSVLQAHEIATTSRKAIFDVDGCIDDATVHVDAQPNRDSSVAVRMHSSSNSASARTARSGGRSPHPARTARTSRSPEKHSLLKLEVHSALAQIRDIFRVSRVKIKHGEHNTIAQVEILVNPELRIRRVHAVARRARELVETVPGIDKADVHLELDDGSKKEQDMAADRDSASENGYSRDGDFDTVKEPSSQAKAALGSGNIVTKGEGSRSPSEYSYSYSERDAPELESVPYSARSHTSDVTNPNQQSPAQQPAMSTPQLLYGRPSSYSSAGPSGNATSGSRGTLKQQPDGGIGGSVSNRTRSASRPLSARKRKRNKRVLAIASDPTISQYISRINQHLMQNVLYRRFKYEKKIISIGTFLADADATARGLMPAKPDFAKCLLSTKLDLGLSVREADKLVGALLKISSGSSAENMVRYGDFVEALRYVHKNAEQQQQQQQQTYPPVVGDGSRSQTPRSLASSETAVASVAGAESSGALSPSQETPVRPNPRVAQLQQDDLTSLNRARATGMTPEQLTSAEAARKEMEQRLRALKESQEAELQKMRDELAAQKEATEQERLALEASKRAHEDMIAAEKDEMAKRKRQEDEREQRERLKREWLAREQAQQKRAKMEKARKAKEDKMRQERMSKEALHIAEEQARLAAEKEKWEQQKRFDEEQAKLREERADAQKAAEIERLERERLAARLAAQDTELKKRQQDWEQEQKRMRQKEAELAEMMRVRESEKADLAHRLELEARDKVLMEEQARKREKQGIERVKEEIGELRSKEEAANRAKEAALRAKVAELEKARASDLRKSKEEAAMEADKARLAFEAELAAKSQEIARKIKEMEEKVQAEKNKATKAAEENAKLAKEAEDAKTLSQSTQKESAAAIAAKEIAANAIRNAEKAKLKEAHERELEELRATLASEQGAREEAAVAVEKAKKAAAEAAEREKAAKEEADLVRRETERKRKTAEEVRKREIAEATEIATQEARAAARAAADAEIAAVRREAAEALEKVKTDAEKEARRLKEEMVAHKKRQVAMSSPTTKLVFDPTHGEQIPQWSKIWDPRSQAYYYQDNFTGETSWDPHAAQWSDTDGDHTFLATAIPRKTPVKTKSPFMNRAVAARRIQCALRGKIGRKRCRKQRGRVHAAMRQSIVDEHIASSPKHLRDSNLLKLPPSEQRWMKCDDPHTGLAYWYDTETNQVKWSPPSASDIQDFEDKMAAFATANVWPVSAVDPLGESTDSLSKSMSLRERRELEASLKEARDHKSPLKTKKKSKKHKLRRKLSIDTDTALQPKGLVQPYESPENAALEQGSSGDAAAYDGSSSSNNILTENNTERSSVQSIGIALTNTERSMGGGATERELAGGDTFPDFDMELPVMAKNTIKESAPTAAAGQPTWEALTTPMGRHIYWYDWSRGVSQWEKPSEVSQMSDSQLGHRVMPPTPKGQGAAGAGSAGAAKGGDKAAELWDLLKRRSKVVATSVRAGWEELRDDRTGEHFFHSARQGLFQWAKPNEWVEEVHIGGVGLPNGGWQEVTTPLGRSLYYINESTGASQWERPAEMSGTGDGASKANPKRQAMRLASTPKAASDVEKGAAAKLWVVLALRSTRVQVIGKWHEFFDPMTKETFYHDVDADEYSWERPDDMQHIAPVTVVGSVGAVAGKKLENAPAHIPRPKLKPISGVAPGEDITSSPAKTHTPVQVWEPVATPKGKHLYYWNNETGESTWEKPTDANPNAKISPDHKRVLQSPDTMAQLQESSEMWSQMRQHAIIEYVQGDWQCLLEHTTNQRFYHDTSTGKHQWEPPQLHGEWIAAGGQHVMSLPDQKVPSKQPEVWHEVRTPKGKNLYFFEATTGRSEWTLPNGVNTVKEHGHLPPSTPKSGGGFGFDSPSATQGAGNGGGGGSAAGSVEPQAAAKMWQVLRARSKQVRHSGDWSELLDEASNEVFYHNSRDGTFTWEIPAELKIGQPGSGAAGGGGDYSITL